MSQVDEQALRDYAEAAEATRDEPYPPGYEPTRPGLNRSKVLGVRLNPEEMDALNAYAESRDVPASALVRGWILQRLRVEQDPDSPAAAVERIGAEVDRLRRLVS